MSVPPSPSGPPARWTVRALAAAVVCGTLIGWWIGRALEADLRATVVLAAAAIGAVIMTAEIVRRRANTAMHAKDLDQIDRDVAGGPAASDATGAGSGRHERVDGRSTAAADGLEPAAGDLERVPRDIRWLYREAVVVVAIALLIGGAAGVSTYLNGQGTGPADRHRVTAVIIKPLTVTSSGPQGARACWTAPDGRLRTGQIAAPPRLVIGDRYPIWVDRDGTPAPPPTSLGAEAWHAAFVGAIAAVLMAAAAVITQRALRRSSGGDRLDTEWRRVAARWRRRYLR